MNTDERVRLTNIKTTTPDQILDLLNKRRNRPNKAWSICLKKPTTINKDPDKY